MEKESPLKQVTDENFETEIIKSDKPALVDFWAPWCGPCKAIGPIVEQLAMEFEGRVKITKMNVDDNHKTAAQFGVQSIPTLILFKDGKVVDKMIGLTSKDRLEGLIKKSIQ
ncbi:MAG: thioredoxin [Syntrophales bacterium]|nr:thioredoxin [Syntrophales bacterium]MDD5234105.1 thioredoxin [Syntrophales bacterium]MDD5532876.1 thioredoxin [Syntrophales bacterium]HPL63756.1 thioredoxin [Syntrophales bacterium]